MKTKKFRIIIRSAKKALDEFEKTFKLVSQRKSKGTTEMVLGFDDLGMVSKVLSPERLRMIQTIRNEKPVSIYQLAKLLRRDQKNVHQDVQYLSKLGILELEEKRKKGQKKVSLQPSFHWDGFEIAVA